MADLNNSFIAGVMNKDLDERLLPEGVYRDALNVTVDTSENSAVGSIQNQMGNTRVSNIATVAGFLNITNAKTIGAVCSEKDNLIYWLVSCDQFDGIFEYNEITGNTLRVLQSNKATPTTPSKLNFSQEFIVTGINYVNGFLYWTDNFNPPRKINIARVKSDSLGIGGYNIDDPRIDDDINVILAPPLNAPSIYLYNDGTQSDNISNKFLYFAYRFKYVDNQYSSLSPFSAVAFDPKKYFIDYNAGYNKAMVNEFNSVDITVHTGSQFVKEIQVVMRDARGIMCSIIETLNKEKLVIQDDRFYTFKFNNNKTYTYLATEEVTRLFDNVPLLAKAQDFVGNRIMYGNYTQFYDVENPVSLSLDLMYEDATKSNPLPTFRSDRDYEIGIVYLDKYGRSTTTLTSLDNTIYIPATYSDKANSIKVNIKNKPPDWATNYRIVIKQSKNKYYTVFPIYIYESGTYRYFLINQSDRDKVQVGKYIIFKSGPNGPTHSNKKYKILELKDYSANTITTSNTAGLYFKIKIDLGDTIFNSLTGLNSYWCPGNGCNGNGEFAGGVLTEIPVDNPNRYAGQDPPIYYGQHAYDPNNPSNPWSMIYHYTSIAGSEDTRITIEVTNVTTTTVFYRYTVEIGANGGWVYTQIGFNNWVSYNPIPAHLCYIKFDSSHPPFIGDKWKINIRGYDTGSSFTKNYFSGKGILLSNTNDPSGNAYPIHTFTNTTSYQQSTGGYMVMAPDVNNDLKIYAGDIITITVSGDLYNHDSSGATTYTYTTPQSYTSPADYVNIEEWFVESGAWQTFQSIDMNGTNQGAKSVSFRRGNNWNVHTHIDTQYPVSQITNAPWFNGQFESVNNPVFMIIQGYGISESSFFNSANANVLWGNLTVQHVENAIIAETEPEESELDIYHELSDTYPVEDGLHKVKWKYADFSLSPYSSGNLMNKTVLGPINNGSPSTTDQKHNYIKGEKVWVKNQNSLIIPTMYYEILYVPDPYRIVIDHVLTVPGTGISGGSVSYHYIEKDQTAYGSYANAAKIKINNPKITYNNDFNAWSFGNGLESNRIKDDWNAQTLEYSIRASTTVDDYGKKHSKNAICYSGIYGGNTSTNKLNEFNLSIANFKYLDGEFGSIQKLYARDTDLIVFQENKISQVLYGKNLLSDAVGGGQVVSIPEVLGTQIAFPLEYGISKNPESFSIWGDKMFFSDSRRGVVLQMAGEQIVEISSNGMKDYFMDLMREYPNTQKLGAYDPHNHQYIIASNNTSILACVLELNTYSKIIPSNGQNYYLFNIISEVDWSISLQNIGYGTNWASNFQTFGYGNQDITAIISENTTGSNRSIKFIVSYCDGKQKEFILEQGSTEYGGVTIIVNS